MSGEEIQKHANEISNKYVPGLLTANERVMYEIAGLPIQDIITIYNNAIWAAKNRIFHDLKPDMSAVETARKTVLKKIREAEAIWTVTDRVTNAPFIDDSYSAWLFSEKEIADECIDYYEWMAKNSTHPVYAYVTNAVGDPVALAERLAKIPNVEGIKLTICDYYAFSEITAATGDRLYILNGPDETMICGLSVGADGAIGTATVSTSAPVVSRPFSFESKNSSTMTSPRAGGSSARSSTRRSAVCAASS